MSEDVEERIHDIYKETYDDNFRAAHGEDTTHIVDELADNAYQKFSESFDDDWIDTELVEEVAAEAVENTGDTIKDVAKILNLDVDDFEEAPETHIGNRLNAVLNSVLGSYDDREAYYHALDYVPNYGIRLSADENDDFNHVSYNDWKSQAFDDFEAYFE